VNCECNSASFVDPEERIFFCFGCGNRSNGQKPRPVIFPEEWQEIERLLLERPVNDMAGLTDLERAGMAKAVIFVEKEAIHLPHAVMPKHSLPLTRSWEPGESIDDLHAQQDEPIRKWKDDLRLAHARSAGEKGKGHVV
jgi:hypothetical protein